VLYLGITKNKKELDLIDIASEWNDSQPIYRQLRDFIVTLILDGSLSEGDALPSVRRLAAEFRVNPLTVLKSYQLLVGEGVVESRRGRGMFVIPGARNLLLASERERFSQEEWPRVVDTLHRLGLRAEELLQGEPQESGSKPTEPPSSDGHR